MNYRTDLNLGEVVYLSIIFHIPVFWPNLLNGYDFYFWWRDTDNQPFRRFQKVKHWPHLVPFVKNAEKSTRKPKCKHRCPKLDQIWIIYFFSVRKRHYSTNPAIWLVPGAVEIFQPGPPQRVQSTFVKGLPGIVNLLPFPHSHWQ